MTKRQTWLFAIAMTLLFSGVFIALTIHSHTRFDELTNSEDITPEVKKGKDVWHEYNCVNCHTLFGEGAYYAPDLTKIASQRGDAYLKQFMKDPGQFYSEDDYGRVMPDLDMSDEEIEQVIAFLKWVDNVDNQDWPPRPIRVTGGAIEQRGVASETPAQGDVAKGRAVFNDSKIACNSCHSTAPDEKIVGPTMAGLIERADEIIASDDYEGTADDAEGYIRESILEPNAHIVPGENHSTGGTSLMPGDYGDRLDDEQVDQLVDYLMSLK